MKAQQEVRAHSEEIILSPLKDARACYRRYKHQLTKEEQEWYENFLAGVYRGDVTALTKICPDVKKRREIIDNYNYDHNAMQRNQLTNTPQRYSRYSPDDYIAAENSPEAAIVGALDNKEKRRTSLK